MMGEAALHVERCLAEEEKSIDAKGGQYGQGTGRTREGEQHDKNMSFTLGVYQKAILSLILMFLR